MHGLDDLFDITASDDGVDEIVLVVLVAALSVEDGGTVVAFVVDGPADLLGAVRHDEKGHLLVIPVHRVEDLRRGKLEDNGVERLIPSEEIAAYEKQHRVEAKDQVPGLHAARLGQIDRDKIRAAAGRVRAKAEADRKSVYDAAEDTDQQDILGQGIGGDQIRQKAGEQDHEEREQRKLLSDILKPYVDREGVDQKVYGRIGKIDLKQKLCQPLGQNRETGRASRNKPSGVDERSYVGRHEKRGKTYHDNSLYIPCRIGNDFFSHKSDNPPDYSVCEVRRDSRREPLPGGTAFNDNKNIGN